VLAVLLLLGCGNKQRQGLYYGNYGYGYGDKNTQDSVVEEKPIPIDNNSPVPSSYDSDTDDEIIPGEFGDNHGLIDDEAYLEGNSSAYDE
jgi:hypothetical protein